MGEGTAMAAGSEWLESYFPAYSWARIEAYYGDASFSALLEHGATLLVAVAGGEGEIMIQERSFSLRRGNVLLLPASAGISCVSSRSRQLHCYVISIIPHQQPALKAAGNVLRQSKLIDIEKESCMIENTEIVELAEQLYIHRLPVEELQHIKNQLVFYDMLYRMLQQLEATEKVEDGYWSLEQSVQHIEANFREKLSREQLAAATGISRSHYSVVFKQLTGCSPNHYVTTLRVHHAMELLLQGKETLREIALKTGYKDEFYLSRRFKQHAGISPSSYLSQFAKRVAVLIPPYSSHLMLLGIEPTVAIADSSEYVSSTELPLPQTMVFMSEACTAEQFKRALLETKTELIIASDSLSAHVDFSVEQLRIAAPVISVSWMEMSWKEHFRYIARVVQESEKAESWLNSFEEEERAARQLIHTTAARHTTVSIIVLKPHGLFAYGARNAGYVIYQSLGLTPPEPIKQQIERHGHKFHSVPITPAELPQYAGDKLLVIVFPDEKGSVAHAEHTFQSPVWKGLEAVRNNQTFVFDQNEWIPYNPVSILYQLRRAVKLFSPGL